MIAPTTATGSTIDTSSAPAAYFNGRLLRMHGPTACLASTMGAVAPFPSIAALHDANVLDLHVSLTAGALTTQVVSKARYATNVSSTDVAAFYQLHLTQASTDVTTVIGGAGGADAHFDATLETGRYSARVFDLSETTTVIVQAESRQQLTAWPLEQLGDWHGMAPHFAEAKMTTAEVFTVAAGTDAPLQAIYSTGYSFAGSKLDVRSRVERALEQHGWLTEETFEDILVFDYAFPGELHFDADSTGTHVTIVGEFELGETDPEPDNEWDGDDTTRP